MRRNALLLLLALTACTSRMEVRQGTDIYVDDVKVGALTSSAEAYNLENGRYYLKMDGRNGNPAVACDIKVRRLDESVLSVVWIWKANENIDSVKLTASFERSDTVGFAMIPSVSYNGNRWGRGREPKGFAENGTVRSWSWRRTPIPGLTYSEDKHCAVALWGNVPENDAFSCSLWPGRKSGSITSWPDAQEDNPRMLRQPENELPECAVHSLIIPEQELPRAYVRRDGYADGYASRLPLKVGDNVKLQAYLCIVPTEPSHRAIRHFLDAAWEGALGRERRLLRKYNVEAMPACANSPELWKRSVSYAKKCLWAEEQRFRGFSIGLTPVPGRDTLKPSMSEPFDTLVWMQRPRGKYEIGWCGQNASYANSLLFDYEKTHDVESLSKALATLLSWSAPEMTCPNGLYVTKYDFLLDPGRERVFDACNLGTAALQFLEASERLEKMDADGLFGNLDEGLLPDGFSSANEMSARLREIAFGILDFAVSGQFSDGCFGKGWTDQGQCVAREGTVGAFLIAPLIKAAGFLPDSHARYSASEYLKSAERAYDYYMGDFNMRGYTTAGALDTWCIDKESSAPLLKASLAFYNQCHDSTYLDDAEALAYYLSTWLWHYRGVYPPESDFSVYGFNTFGMTSVSVQHHHLDPYALISIPELLELSDLTGHACWSEKALAIWKAGNQLVSDGDLSVHGFTRPEGSQNEAFLHCGWGWKGNPGEIRLNDWLVAWPGAFRLEVLRKVSDWNILE